VPPKDPGRDARILEWVRVKSDGTPSLPPPLAQSNGDSYGDSYKVHGEIGRRFISADGGVVQPE
jgi:hypothetical protein